MMQISLLIQHSTFVSIHVIKKIRLEKNYIWLELD